MLLTDETLSEMVATAEPDVTVAGTVPPPAVLFDSTTEPGVVKIAVPAVPEGDTIDPPPVEFDVVVPPDIVPTMLPEVINDISDPDPPVEFKVEVALDMVATNSPEVAVGDVNPVVVVETASLSLVVDAGTDVGKVLDSAESVVVWPLLTTVVSPPLIIVVTS